MKIPTVGHKADEQAKQKEKQEEKEKEDEEDDDDDDEEDEEDEEGENSGESEDDEDDEEGGEGKKQDEFLSMKLNLQPHTTQVEKCVVDGVGDVEVVTMPFNDYNIQVVDSWLDYGTPTTQYRNLWYNDNGGMYSGINRITYFFGIIDILMLYTPRKSVERFYKTIRYHGQGEVSSCPPNRYAVRFLSFINASTF